jgi:hypothetical protein
MGLLNLLQSLPPLFGMIIAFVSSGAQNENSDNRGNRIYWFPRSKHACRQFSSAALPGETNQ